jgi:DNA-binding transcriptional LysR family regulator
MFYFDYHIFAAVAEEKSFIRAAEKLCLSPPAVSHAVAKMEKECGLNLFYRDRKGARLTPDGARLLPRVRAILHDKEKLEQEITSARGLEKSCVCIGTFNSVCVNWIPDIVNSFRERFPNIFINICQGGYNDVLEWLQTGVADMCFVSLTIINENIEFVPLFRDQIMCVTDKNFQPRDPGFVTIDDIRDQTFVCQGNGDDAETDALLNYYLLPINSFFSVDNDDAVISLVESGCGISLLPELVLRKIVHTASVYPFEPPRFRTIGLATLKKKPLSITASKMHRHIQDFFKMNNMSNFE